LPDLNSVDYSVWGILQEKLYKTRTRSTDLDELKRRLRMECAQLWSRRHCGSHFSVESLPIGVCQW